MTNRNNELSIEERYKIMVLIWAALLISQLLFVLVVFLVKPDLFSLDLSASFIGASSAMTLGFAVAAFVSVMFSFAFRRRLDQRAIDTGDPALAQSSLVIALALCEASSIFGLALAIGFDYQYFFLWSILGIAGTVAHFPKRELLHATKTGPLNR